MKTQTFKVGKTFIVRITLSAEEIDEQLIRYIGVMGPGLARAAENGNTMPLYPTQPATYELRFRAPDDYQPTKPEVTITEGPPT